MMTTLASNWFWVPACACAFLLIAWDWSEIQKVKRLVLVTAVLTACLAPIAHAAAKPSPDIVISNPCDVEPLLSAPWWQRLLAGCL